MTDDDSAEGEGVYWVVPWDGQGARIYLGNIAPGNLVAAIRDRRVGTAGKVVGQLRIQNGMRAIMLGGDLLRRYLLAGTRG